MVCVKRVVVCLIALLVGTWVEASLRPSHVLVLANSNSERSLEVARYYMDKRGIPERNLIALPLSLDEVIDWDTYLKTLHNPLIDAFVGGGWMQADASGELDRIGRKHVAVYGHDIDFLVFSMDVPLKISEDAGRMPSVRPNSIRQEFWTNRASVDSELSMLPLPESAVVAYMPNPLFNVMNPGRFTRQQVMRIARLDGPSKESVLRLVDNALAGEAQGVRGRAYIDYSQKYPQGDEWLKTTRHVIEKMGFDLTEEFQPELIDWHQRFDAPALYFGWWSWDLQGLMSDPNFRFPTGAIVFHIHSFSANTLRTTEKNWVGPLVHRGAAVTVGNVYEPYLQLTHYPHLFMDALARGKSAGVAAYTALPILSWHTIFVGDPLYTPFGKTLGEQLDAIATDRVDPLDQYVVIRKMNLLREAGKIKDALELGKRYMTTSPGLALAYQLAKLELEQGKINEALAVIRLMDSQTRYPVEEQALAYEVAQFLFTNGARRASLTIYENLLDKSVIHPRIERHVLADAISVANTVGETLLVEKWRSRQKLFVAPESP